MAFTSHGHHIPFTFLGDDPPKEVEGCGGVRLCLPCTLEAMPHVPAFKGERGKAYLESRITFDIMTVAN